MALRHIIKKEPKIVTPFDYPFQWAAQMARQPKLRKKSVGRYVYWFTKTGGDTNFGRVDEVPHQQAQKLFADHLSRIFAAEKDSKRQFLTVGELMDLFLDWVQKNRSEDTYRTRRNY